MWHLTGEEFEKAVERFKALEGRAPSPRPRRWRVRSRVLKRACDVGAEGMARSQRQPEQQPQLAKTWVWAWIP